MPAAFASGILDGDHAPDGHRHREPRALRPRHRGAIAINSELGKGSVFHVVLPVDVEADSTQLSIPLTAP
jgi:hypothetical protein